MRRLIEWLPTVAMLALYALIFAMIPRVMAWEDQRAQQQVVARIQYAVMVEGE